MALFKPSVARGFATIDSNTHGDTYQLGTTGREIVGILATAGGGALFVRIYDSANGAGAIEESIPIAANQGESTPFTPTQPIPFKKGIYIVFEQGGSTQGGGEVTIIHN